MRRSTEHGQQNAVALAIRRAENQSEQKYAACWECVVVDMVLIVLAVVALASAVTLLLAKPKKKRERSKGPTNAP
jgi:arginine exporter protein ArgO